MIKHIDGGVDAILLQDHIEQARDPEACYFHIGWGTDHRARWSRLPSAAPKRAHAR
jgi:hypothetical protein